MPTGYAHPSYIHALSEFGEVVDLLRPGAWLLSRRIAGSDRDDAIGPYPFFSCCEYAELRAELDRLDTLVSISVVPDLFSFGSASTLSKVFDYVVPFKTHYLTDLEIGFSRNLRRHHRRYASRGLSNFDVKLAADPAAHAAEWVDLYQKLVIRHRISGLRAFTPRSLTEQLKVPGSLYFRALRDGTVHGALVCYLDRGVAYAHLTSTTSMGQELFAQYALYWTAIEYCRARARWFALGSNSWPTEWIGNFRALLLQGWMGDSDVPRLFLRACRRIDINMRGSVPTRGRQPQASPLTRQTPYG